MINCLVNWVSLLDLWYCSQVIFTLHACARGKAIGLSVVISTKMVRSHVLGICACCKHNQSVNISEKLVCMRFKLLKNAY